MDGEFYWNDGPQQASFPSKAPISADEMAHSQKLEDIELWKPLSRDSIEILG